MIDRDKSGIDYRAREDSFGKSITRLARSARRDSQVLMLPGSSTTPYWFVNDTPHTPRAGGTRVRAGSNV